MDAWSCLENIQRSENLVLEKSECQSTEQKACVLIFFSSLLLFCINICAVKGGALI